MAVGFESPPQAKGQSRKKKDLKPDGVSVSEIQNNLLGYIEGIEDPRVARTQKHLLKDILAIACLSSNWGSRGLGRSGKLWYSQTGMVVRVSGTPQRNP